MFELILFIGAAVIMLNIRQVLSFIFSILTGHKVTAIKAGGIADNAGGEERFNQRVTEEYIKVRGQLGGVGPGV